MSIDKFIQSAEKRIKKKKEITEADIENAFVKYAKSQGCIALKLIILSKRGFPDRTVLCSGGRVFFVEFKREGKTQTGTQKVVMKMLLGLGFEYNVCDEIGQAERILDLFLKSEK